MTYAILNNYIEHLAFRHLLIKDFIMGDYEEIIDLEKTDIKYPAVFFETPEVEFIGNADALSEQWKGNLTIIAKSNNTNPIESKYNREITFRIARHFLFKIAQEFGGSVIKKGLTPINILSSDLIVGWRLDFSIECPSDELCDDDINPHWSTDVIYFDEILTFSFDNNSDNSSFNVDIAYLPLPSVIYDLKYSIDGGPMVPVLSNNVNVPGTYIYIQLQATYPDGSTHFATAFLTKDTPSSFSVPYKFTPYA